MIQRIALLAVAGLLAACGGGSQESPAPAGTTGGAYQEGVHWHRLATPLPAADNEVTEAFSYACPACAQFQPEVDAWKRERGDAVVLRYVPVVFSPAWDPHARTFHTAQAMGVFSRVHRPIFTAMYQQGRPGQTLEQLADIVQVAGIDRSRFLEVARSAEVEAAMAQAREWSLAAGITSTPTLVVAGRYRVELRQRGDSRPFAVADWLLANLP
ncbi:MAG: thiol:disulfide interchange protein DsbA/DsbL [Xanthomonadales bacterium]|nr:thiol:disulfide interchange protein DsbA/DsbL [Xanthomonadales bacterium]